MTARTSQASLALILLAAPAAAQDISDVMVTYADIAAAAYGDSLTTAQALDAAIAALIADPSEASLQAARDAWRTARDPYMQTEVYRFGNAIVDDWEVKVNAWPLDEGLIDYVDAGYGGPTDANELAALDIIANPAPMIAGQEVDASQITPELIADTLNEAGGIETNVARGYHAIEFLLWGQDLNFTGPGAGDRPWTDYLQGEGCTGGNCDRRADYLQSASTLMLSDLEWMAEAWAPGGDARVAVMAENDAGLTTILTGMGSLSYGEQAGQRMRLGLMLNDPEEEHDCFSDNTHMSHFYDQVGVENVYFGHYRRIDGSMVEGPSLADLVAAADPALDEEMRAKLAASRAAVTAIVAAAEGGMAYDMMLARGNDAGEALINGAVDALIDQTHSVERISAALGAGGIVIEGSDSLDNPETVFQ